MTAEDVRPHIAAVPLQDAIGEAPDDKPKRGPGRPRRDPGDTAPRARRTRAVRSPLKTRVGAAIVKLNLGITIAAQFAPGLDAEKDPLSSHEIVALADGLVAQADQHPTFRKYLEAFADATSGADLLLVVAVIIARRGARHGVLPESIDVLGGAIMGEPDALASLTNDPAMLGQMAAMMQPAGADDGP